MDTFRAMRVFARVVDEGSFASAARAMRLAPAVVTRLIAELEEDLGARLLNRTTRRIALTDVGEAYLERVRQILIDVEEADALAGAATGEPRGHLRVLVPPAFAVHQLAKHLPTFRARYPRVSLDLTVPGPVTAVDENVDVTILMDYQRGLLTGDFIARRLARSEIVGCAAPEYLDRRGRPLHPDELAQHDVFVPPTAGARRDMTLFRGVGGDDEPPGEQLTIGLPPSVLSTTHIDTMYAAALAGMGIAPLPSFVVEDALVEQALERVLPSWRMPGMFSIYAAMPSRKHVPARTRALIDFLVETFGGEDRDPWLAAAGCETL